MASMGTSTSAIEELIGEIEAYIDNCKYQPLSNTKIIVNKEEIDELLRELRMKVPEEVRRYQKIIVNKEAILDDAKAKAEDLMAETAERSSELINEHEITKKANEQADLIVEDAVKRAQVIMDNATKQANAMKASAVQYTDKLLAEFELVITKTLSMSQKSYEAFAGQLVHYQETVRGNRAELKPSLQTAPPAPQIMPAQQQQIPMTGGQQVAAGTVGE